jgi:hypothetical protein
MCLRDVSILRRLLNFNLYWTLFALQYFPNCKYGLHGGRIHFIVLINLIHYKFKPLNINSNDSIVFGHLMSVKSSVF